MKKAFVGLLAFVGGLTLLVAVVAVIVGLTALLLEDRIPENTVLEVDLERGLLEYQPDDPLSSFTLRQTLTVRDFVEALEQAGSDERVKGLVATLGASGHGFAVAQELRDAVLSFRQRGKFAVAYSETFGEFGPGNGGYYLASAFDEIWLQPSGDVGLTGLMYESLFIRGTLEKLDMEPRLGQRHEYKNAMNMYTEKGYTVAHREAMEALVNSQFAQVLRGVAEGRGLEVAELRALVDRGPYLGPEALEARLVDGLAYRDEVYQKARESAGTDGEFLFLRKYLERAGRPHEEGATFALIYGVGSVLRGSGGYDPLAGEFTMGSAAVSGAFRDAVDDDDVKAIIFRVSSPGGSYVASDTILRETVRAREAGKPVVVSMGNVAASGGYFVAMKANHIVAQPGTITGSIGVLGGKLLTEGLWSKLGVSWDEVHTSANARMWAYTHDYSPAELARREAWLDRIYADFTGKVAEGRGLELERVQQIAKGRVWSGEDAERLGLVDALGGYSVALGLAREAAGLAADAPVKLEIFPRKRSPLEALFEESGENSEPVETALGGRLRELQSLMRELRAAGLLQGGEDQVLRMPPIRGLP